jgi:hypothetical protein
MFALPQNPTVVADGHDDDHPLKLEGVKLHDMKLFIRVGMATE